MEPVVSILPQDPVWPEQQRIEIARLRAALNSTVVEPIGSVAVPGITGKPAIDILLGTKSMDLAQLRSVLQGLGYGEGEAQSDQIDILFFERVTAGGNPNFHLHVAPLDGPYWCDLIRFRDALRSDRELAARYECLKRELALRHPHDIDAYAAGKSEFVASVLRTTR